MPKKPKYILDFKDKDGRRVVWEKESYNEHAKTRKELLEKSFLDRIIRARQEPDVIIESHIDKRCLCYYILEYRTNGRSRYTKVIVKSNINKIDYIKTAFRPDHIKELKYHKPIWQRKKIN